MSTLLSAGQLPPNRHDDLENYGIDAFDDPFATPSPPSSPKKRKEPASQGLGIDEQVSVQKRARIPKVKLDEDRLLGEAGLPKLRQRARELKIKGKGHEFSDAARLLSFYQVWLDDLFPKAKFLDALAMVEKAGHKKRVVTARNELMNEGKIKAREEEDPSFGLDVNAPGTDGVDAGQPTRIADGNGPSTPVRGNDVPDDDNLYDTTPKTTKSQTQTGVPDDGDDLDALIAEAENQDQAAAMSASFKSYTAGIADREYDDIDVLIAEAEVRNTDVHLQQKALGNNEQAFVEEEAAMRELDGMQ